MRPMNPMRLTIFLTALLLSTQALAIRPISGWYWNPDQPGSGLNLEVRELTDSGELFMFAAVFTYDESGAPTWFTIAGNYNELTRDEWYAIDGAMVGSVTSELIASQGGNCLGCPFQQNESASTGETAELVFLDNRNAELNVRGTTITLRHFAFSNNFRADGDFLTNEWDINGVRSTLNGSRDFHFIGRPQLQRLANPLVVRNQGQPAYSEGSVSYIAQGLTAIVASNTFPLDSNLAITYVPEENAFFADVLSNDQADVIVSNGRFRVFVYPDFLVAWGIDSFDGTSAVTDIVASEFNMNRIKSDVVEQQVPIGPICNEALNGLYGGFRDICEDVQNRTSQQFPDFGYR